MTREVAITGALMISVAVCFSAWKIFALGMPLMPADPEGIWQVELEVEADGVGEPVLVRAAVPSSDEVQRIFDDRSSSDGIEFALQNQQGGRNAVWSGPFTGRRALQHSFHVELSESKRRSPSDDEEETQRGVGRRLDALASTADVPASAPELRDFLDEQDLPGDDDRRGRALTLLAFVTNEIRSNNSTDDAIKTLQDREGSHLGRARLLAALLRATNTPALLVHGLHLRERQALRPRAWVDAWIDEWVPMSPSDDIFGALPPNWVVLGRADGAPISANGADALRWRYRAVRDRLDANELATVMTPPNAFAAALSLFRLPVATQETLRVLLLLPLGALATAIWRNLIGIPTFGTFMPILVALAVRNTSATTGVALLFGVLAFGTASRLLMNPLRLLLVPRLCILLCVVVLALTATALLGRELELSDLLAGVLLPVVILVMLIERFTVTLAEEGTRHAVTRLTWTVVVAATIYPLFRSELAGHFLFVFPETIIAAMGVLTLIGGYTGYRLTELWRFRALTGQGGSAGGSGASA